MTIAILIGENDTARERNQWFVDTLTTALLTEDPTLDIQVWPNIQARETVDMALVWRHPPHALKEFPHLRCIASLGAGVDWIMSDDTRPKQIPVVRIVDTTMAKEMSQYITAVALWQIKCFPKWTAQQAKQQWLKQPPFSLEEAKVGIMGLGHLGRAAADALLQLQVPVVGWSRTPKHLDNGMSCFSSKRELNVFLAQADILVCLLPLTPQTENILSQHIFYQLPKGAYLIHVGRGEQLVDTDLIEAIDSEHLSGATLDVFRTEPLPNEHPFWTHPKIQVTPHISCVTNPASVVPQLLDNYHRLKTGQSLMNQVDPIQGY